MKAGLMVATTLIVIAGVWAIGLATLPQTPVLLPLTVVHLSVPPAREYDFFGEGPDLSKLGGVGVDASGNILVAPQSTTSSPICCSPLFRYDPRRNAWLSGYFNDQSAFTSYPTLTRTGVSIAGFNIPETSSVVFSKAGATSDLVSAISSSTYAWTFPAVAADGSAWLAIWRTGTSPTGCARACRTKPFLLHIKATGRMSWIRLPSTVAPTAVEAEPNGTVWALDSTGQCQHGNCPPPTLIRYDGRRFKTFKIAPSVWPEAYVRERAHQTGESLLVAGRHGEMWVVDLDPVATGPHDIRLISFSDGRFSSLLIDPGMWVDRPLIDRKGDIWFCGGNGVPIVVDPPARTLTRLKQRGGTLVETARGDMDYVLPSHPGRTTGCLPNPGLLTRVGGTFP